MSGPTREEALKGLRELRGNSGGWLLLDRAIAYLEGEATMDRFPETEEERAAILGVFLDQLRQLGEAAEFRVTCPCGRETTLSLAARCHWCGIWFCRRCADRHFGSPPTIKPSLGPVAQ